MAESLTRADLQQMGKILAPLQGVAASRGRLKSALALTFRGCVASEWQSAFICFAAAAEAILTYSSGPGLTDRLARAYATLVPSSPERLDASESDFRHLYGVRSEIIHGRAHDRRDQAGNLEDLARFGDALRQLWSAILSSAEVRAILEGDDEQRRALFAPR